MLATYGLRRGAYEALRAMDIQLPCALSHDDADARVRVRRRRYRAGYGTTDLAENTRFISSGDARAGYLLGKASRNCASSTQSGDLDMAAL